MKDGVGYILHGYTFFVEFIILFLVLYDLTANYDIFSGINLIAILFSVFLKCILDAGNI